MSFSHAVEIVGKGLDTVGIAAIAIGIILAGLTVVRDRSLVDGNGFRLFRQGVGRAILLGLEFLVAADIIRTVALSPSLKTAAVLAVIVLIRTFLSFALEVELDGRWPWQAHKAAPANEGR
jgi:uncharacterized membrane protein